MAWYADDTHVEKVLPGKTWWTDIYGPGDRAPKSGIYRCDGCGKEISHNEGVSLPAQNHGQHSPSQGDIRWKLIVRANTTGI
jgi:hypothetical protein